jgi:hypothetical protein
MPRIDALARMGFGFIEAAMTPRPSAIRNLGFSAYKPML